MAKEKNKFEVLVDNASLVDVKKKLDDWGNTIAMRLMTAASKKSFRQVVKAAKQLVPVRYGALKRSLGTRAKRYGKSRSIIILGPRVGYDHMVDGTKHDPARYGYIVEFGTRNSKPQPFMRPALEQRADSVINEFHYELRKQVDKEARKQFAKKVFSNKAMQGLLK
ncbi:hypothetical protein M0R72_13705 [Candidatus Pacearchaeota archaeon]|jgi:HK97 gp10 family phage protein|nr:hypothetical protein [Candidatus Pacearchaeota archaeon]